MKQQLILSYDICNEILNIKPSEISQKHLNAFYNFCLQIYDYKLIKSTFFKTTNTQLIIENLEKILEVLTYLIKIYGWDNRQKKCLIQMKLTLYYLCKINKKSNGYSLLKHYAEKYNDHLEKHATALALRSDVNYRKQKIQTWVEKATPTPKSFRCTLL